MARAFFFALVEDEKVFSLLLKKRRCVNASEAI
jgi:hypothetical protein